MGLLISSFVWRSLASDCIPSSQKVCWETLVLYLMLNVCATLCLSLRRRVTTYSGILSVLINILWVGIKSMAPGSFQWCPATERAMGTNWNTGSSIQIWEWTSLPRGWQSTGKGCPERLNISSEVSTKPSQMLSHVTYYREPALASPFQTLQFCDILSYPGNPCFCCHLLFK